MQTAGKDPTRNRIPTETNEGSDTSGLHTSRVQTDPRHRDLLSSSIVCCCGAALAVTLTL